MPTHSLLLNNTLNEISNAIDKTGYVIIENAFSDKLLNQLYQRISSLNPNELREAKVGRGSKSNLVKKIRSDKTCWLENNHATDRKYLSLMDKLQSYLNRHLFLGLCEYECHYAVYEAETYYKKHLDVLGNKTETYPDKQTIANKNRVVSSILYLNKNWNHHDGGELRLFDKHSDALLKTIYPEKGRLVLFLSEEFPHEVITTTRIRYSITGWFRILNSI